MPIFKSSWHFAECNSTEEVHPCSIEIRETAERVHQYLSHHLSNDESGHNYSFHLVDDECSVRHQLSELFTIYTPSYLGGERVLIHRERPRQQTRSSQISPPQTDEAIPVQMPEAIPAQASQPSCTTNYQKKENKHESLKAESKALLHLEFVPPDRDALPWPDDIWRESSMEVLMDSSMWALENKLKDVIVRNLQRDVELLTVLTKTDGRGVDGLLTFLVGTLQLDYDKTILRPEVNGHRLETISDVFEDLTPPNKAINVMVNLDLDERPKSDPDYAPAKRKISMGGELSLAEGRVVQKRMVLPRNYGWEYVMTRIGTVRSAPSSKKDVGSAKNLNGTKNGHKEADLEVRNIQETDVLTYSNLRKGNIDYESALIGYYFKGLMQGASDLNLIKVMAWNFGDYCIGDCDSSWEEHQFSRQDKYMPQYKGVAFRSQLHRRVQNHLDKANQEPGAGVPFMPYYTHNVYDPARYGLGVADQGTDIVVRYVNNFTTAAKKLGLEVDLELPWHSQFLLAPEETSDSITKLFTRVLRDSEGKEKGNSHVLFEQPLKDTWSLQLWVLPQPRHIKKLFKFPTNRAGSTDRLGEFLAPDKVEKDDYRLYMEAHVVPKSHTR